MLAVQRRLSTPLAMMAEATVVIQATLTNAQKHRRKTTTKQLQQLLWRGWRAQSWQRPMPGWKRVVLTAHVVPLKTTRMSRTPQMTTKNTQTMNLTPKKVMVLILAAPATKYVRKAAVPGDGLKLKLHWKTPSLLRR